MFEFNGMPITLEQVEESAKESNMDIDSYIKKAEKDGLIDKRKPAELGKSTPTTPGAVVEETAAPNIGMLNLDSNLVNTLLESPNKETQKQFLNSVESFHSEDFNKHLKFLLKKYDAGFLTNENKINPGLNAADSAIYKERLDKVNKEYNDFYNDIAQKEYEALLNNKAKEFETFDPTSGLTIGQNFALGVAKTFESLFDISKDGIGFSFEEGLTGVNKGPLLNAKDAFTAAKKLDAYSSAEQNIEARKQRIIQQGKDEGWSDKVLQEQLNFFTDPTNSSGKKIANNEEEFKEFLKINKSNASLEMLSKLAKADQQFLQLFESYGPDSEIIDKNGNINLTFGKTARFTGQQFTQLLFSSATAPIAPGRATYMQEIGPMMTEALEQAAIKEFGEKAIAEMSESNKREKYAQLIEEGKLDLSKLETSAIFSGLLDTAGTVFQGIKIAKAGAPLLRNIFKRKFQETLKIALSKGADVGQATVGETLTEIAQEGLNVMGVAEAAGTKQNWASKRFSEVGLQTLITTPLLVGGGRGIKSTATQLKRIVQGAYDPNSLRAEINNQKKVVKMLEENKKISSEEAANEIDNLSATEDIISNSLYNKFEPEAKAEMINIIAKEKGIKRKIDKLKNTYDADSVFSAGQVKALQEQLEKIENEKQSVIPTQNYLVSEKILLKHINNNPEKYNNYKVFSFETNDELVDFAKRNNIPNEAVENILGKQEEILLDDEGKILPKGPQKQDFAFGAEIPSQKIFILSKENVKKARGLNKTVGGNVIHHELGHVIMSSLSDSDINNFIKNIRTEAEKLPEGSKLKEAFELAKARVKASYSDQSNRVKSEEILTSMSDFLRALDENILVDDASFLSKTFSFLAEKLNLATGEQIDFSGLAEPQQALQFFQKYNKSLGNSKNLFQRIKKVSATSARPEVSDEIEKFSKSISGDQIQKIFDEKGKDGAFDIIQAYKPLTSKLTNKYKNVPGFDFELLQSEIEIGKRGLLDIINAYDPSKGATLNTYIQGQLANRSIEAANRILDTDFKLDVTEAKGITDTTTEEITEEVIEKPSEKLQSLRKRMNIGDEIKPVVFDAVRKTFGTKLPSVTEKAFKTELEKSFRIELKKPIAKLMGRTEDYRSFLSNNFEAIYDALPQSIINKRLTEFAEPVMKDGKQVREKTAEGNKVFTKKKISKAEWIKYFLGSEVGRSTQGTRKTALAEALSEAFALDATMEVLSDPTVLQKVKDIGELTGIKISDTFIQDVSRLIGRPTNLKFSLSIKEKNAIEDITEIYKRDILNTLNSEKVNLIDDLDFYIFERFDKYINENKNLDEILINVTKDINQYIIDEKSKKKIEEKILDVKNGINREYFLNLKAEVGIANQKEIAEIGYSSATNLLEERLNKANEKNKIKIINDFIKNEAKSITTFNGLKDITKNIHILNKVLDPILKKYNIKGYKIGINPKGRGQSIFFNDQVISKYKSATQIKKSFNDFKDLINEESEEAIKYIIDLAEYYKNQNKKNEGLGHIKLLTNDQIGAFRKMGKAGMYVEGLETKRTTLEHQETILSLYNAVQDYFDNKINLKKLENILKKSQVNLVTKRVDNALAQSGQKSTGENRMLHPFVIKAVQKDINDGIIYKDIEKVYKNNEIKFSKSTNKKLRVFDFDDTLARSKSNVLYTMPDGTKGKLNAGQFAKQGDDLLQQGAEFDFSEFSKVIEGQKGPMFDVAKAILDKRGDEDLFILTARPAEAKYAIQPFLEGLGLPFRLENIIGLGNGSPQAKADWIASKLNLGYNDVYFADDALKNVEAVAKTLSAYDIKYRSQAVKASKSLDTEFNKILQESTGVEFYKEYSPVKAELLGRGKDKFKFFVPYDADDFVGLLYTTLAKGKTGDAQMEWYKENLLKPFSRGIQQYEAAKQRALRDWADLKAQIKKDVPAGLNKQNETGFRNQDSVRIYIWHTQGVDMASKEMGMSKSDLNDNLKYVRKNPALKAFADKLMALNIDGYPDPTANWTAGDITTDLVSYINDVKRKEYLQPWKDNIDIIFSDKNKNKLKALYGNSYIESLDDMLYRMWNGRNRRVGITKKERAFQDWINNSVGTVMFFNSRSALLQTISAINFINFTDNNPINAALAFANQKQYWADFSELFNSDFLKQRRSGLQIDINADEIANAAATSRNKAKAALSAILKLGFTPTQIADSFAIASGGATFYRNRIKKYLKEGLTKEEAQKKAFEDFQETAEESQQSARPDRISMQQASSLGRTILAWGNTPMQYARIQKKAALDLINGRGDWKTNVSKIMYYGVIQNIIFSALQQGMFALLFSDEEDEKEKERYFRVGNSMLDTFLRGAGIYGAVASTAKNVIMEIIDQAKSSRPDYTQAAIAATTISPPVNSKLRKLISAGKTFTYKQSKEKVFTEGFSLENPAFLAGGQVISAVANIPVDRIVQKADHIYTAMKPETELWQSIALSLGWSEWDLNMLEKQTKKPSTIYKTSKSRGSRKSRNTR